MLKLVKFIVGVALLPLCWSVSVAVYNLYQSTADVEVVASGLEAWSLPAGFGIWLLLFFLLPRPFRTYVLAHELTHALWAVLMGAKVGRIKVGKNGGHVELSKSNFIITLAPYFFPLYCFLVIAGYYAAGLRFDVAPYKTWWLGAVGFTWGFHITFTIYMLMERQPDVQEHGHLFSYVVIYFMNVLLMGIWIVLIGFPTFGTFAELMAEHVREAYACAFEWCVTAWNYSMAKVDARSG
ncbi:MAG: hypothetical protein K9M45_13610 [Kiritimatiellales bacterium]|nr:hypothetical protein [Kiritimatiellales bacterium]